MDDEFDFVTIIVAVWVAGYLAMMLDHVAVSELGWSLAQIRGSAIIGALLTSALTLAAQLQARRGKLPRRG